MKHYMGIDPGYSGAIVVIDEDGGFVGSVRLSATEHDVSSFVIEHAPANRRAFYTSWILCGAAAGFLLGSGFATLLTMVVVPVLYATFYKQAPATVENPG